MKFFYENYFVPIESSDDSTDTITLLPNLIMFHILIAL
jgi:hypothetical protein